MVVALTPDYLVHAQDDSDHWRSTTEPRRNQCPKAIESTTTVAGWVGNPELEYLGVPMLRLRTACYPLCCLCSIIDAELQVAS